MRVAALVLCTSVIGCGGGGPPSTPDAGVAPTTQASLTIRYASGDTRTVTIDAAHPPYVFGLDSAPFGSIYAACDFVLRDAGPTGFEVDLAVHRNIDLPCSDPEAFDGLLMSASVLTPGMQNVGVSIQACGGQDYVSARASDCMIPVVQSGPSGTSFTATFTGCVLQSGAGPAPAITLDGTLTMSGCTTR